MFIDFHHKKEVQEFPNSETLAHEIMTNNKIQKYDERIADDAIEALDEHLTTKEIMAACHFVGAMAAAHVMSKNLSAVTIRAVQQIRDDRLYRVYGFTRFDDFLDQHPDSPMSYRRFNELEVLLKKEGEPLYNFLNGMSVPIYKRQRIGQGRVQLDNDGETIVITHDDGGAPTFIERKNSDQILNMLAQIADDRDAKARQIEKQKLENERAATANKKLREELETVRASKDAGVFEQSLQANALLEVIASLGKLRSVAETMTLVERDQFAPRIFTAINGAMKLLTEVYGEAGRIVLPRTGEAPPIPVAGEWVDDDTRFQQLIRASSAIDGAPSDVNDEELAALLTIQTKK